MRNIRIEMIIPLFHKMYRIWTKINVLKKKLIFDAHCQLRTNLNDIFAARPRKGKVSDQPIKTSSQISQ